MEVLLTLAILACPVGMGLMMWFMAKGKGGSRRGAAATSLDDLQAEHQRLGSEIERLEGERRKSPPPCPPPRPGRW